MSSAFVHLHLHSEYSLIDGLVRIKPLLKGVVSSGMVAVAVTDHCNLFALIRFYSAARSAGVKPIIGAELRIRHHSGREKAGKLVLLCRTLAGYRNLCQLISRAYLEGQHQGLPYIERGWLGDHHDGLIALSGGRGGDVGQALVANRKDQARQLLEQYRQIFGDNYYLELQRTGRAGEEHYLHAAVELATELDLPVVATNDVVFLQSEDFDAHEVRVAIHNSRMLEDPHRPREYSEEQYLRTPEEMVELFSDIPEAIANSVEIARRCNVELTLGKYFLPDFPIPEGMSEADYFRHLSRQGLERRLQKILDPEHPDFASARQPYDERLETELEVIINMGFPGYFLIVADFIQWSKSQADPIPVGPGRGSGAGSLVAYALTITDLDPLAYDLLFERFLNPERVSMPDFDIDFCMDGRDRVIDYVARQYGRDKVSQIITYGSMAAKAVIRDVGRVYGHGYGFVDSIAKLIPFELGMTLSKALEQEETLRQRYEEEEEVTALIDMARQLEGLKRNAGKHAGGVVIAPTALTDFAPLYCEEGGGNVVTQFDKDDVEKVGLVKFDFLGLKTLTVIDWAVKNVKLAHNRTLDITSIPLDDKPTFELLKQGQTTAVFQLESRGMKDLILRLQPDTFEDIIALVALFRPGPLGSGMVDDFINRKHGRAKVEYPHPDLEPALSPTYGVILYQEQVQRIAQVLAGYSLGGADLLRRAMGKKKPEEMAKQRAIFTTGALERGIEEENATYIFDLMEKFAGYGFNKSHSAAYALVAYQTAWLKQHYPSAFMAAVLSADIENTDKVVFFIDECETMAIRVLPPDVNHSAYKFVVLEDGTIVYGLGAIKGVGSAAISAMVEERQKFGAFKDLFDFCQRIDLRKMNKRVLETLVRAGALDQLGANRATLLATLPRAMQIAEQISKNSRVGMGDLFGFGRVDSSGSDGNFIEKAEWPEQDRLRAEKETLGLYLTGHPIEEHLPELEAIGVQRIATLQPEAKRKRKVAGLVISIRTRDTKGGKRFAFVTLDDRSGRIEVAVFSNLYQESQALLARDQVLVVEGEVNRDDYSGENRFTADALFDLERAREHYGRVLQLELDRQQWGETPLLTHIVPQLEEVLQPYCDGLLPITIRYGGAGARATLTLGEQWQIRPAQLLLERLRRLLGEEMVTLRYNQ
ncbi:MAG: DNA polymerase III subunit alpha [Gammaproteobacteria bacterium]|nr:DNA polymerase III subunit alpha [Gammaproteobacteria bacterium]